jgi:hypothetical protein
VIMTTGISTKIVIFVFLLAWIAFQSEVQGHPFVPQFRGGSFKNKEECKTATASLAVLGNNSNRELTPPWLADASSPACFLFHNQDLIIPFGSIANLPDHSDSVETLALLCDVVLLMANDDDEQELDQLLTAVINGANRRLSTSLEKGKLLIVSTSGKNSLKLQELVQTKLAGKPPVFHSIETVTMEALETQLQEYLTDAYSISSLLPAENNGLAFVKLLYQVYRSNQGSSLEEFQFQNLPRPRLPTATRRHERDSDSAFSGDNIQSTLLAAQSQLASLESKLENVMLNGKDIEMPLLEFGNIANDILNEAYGNMSGAPPAFRRGILAKIVSELERLYKDHVQLLRNYYGKRYETFLETKDDENEWAAAAEHMTQGFQAATSHAVPTLCQSGRDLAEGADFDSMSVLNGLINDMIEATNMRKEEQSLGLEQEDEEADASLRSKIADSIPPWLKKLAARAVVLGVNYVQGWLAWQGLKRAAAERDRNMPKFPLF